MSAYKQSHLQALFDSKSSAQLFAQFLYVAENACVELYINIVQSQKELHHASRETRLGCQEMLFLVCFTLSKMDFIHWQLIVPKNNNQQTGILYSP